MNVTVDASFNIGTRRQESHQEAQQQVTRWVLWSNRVLETDVKKKKKKRQKTEKREAWRSLITAWGCECLGALLSGRRRGGKIKACRHLFWMRFTPIRTHASRKIKQGKIVFWKQSQPFFQLNASRSLNTCADTLTVAVARQEHCICFLIYLNIVAISIINCGFFLFCFLKVSVS